MYWAGRNGHDEVVRVLIQAGANVNTPNKVSFTVPLLLIFGRSTETFLVEGFMCMFYESIPAKIEPWNFATAYLYTSFEKGARRCLYS